MKIIDPNLDGITHINVYSGSRTELGRMLSNFCREEIYTKDGWFMSVEAYWFWLGISPDCKERECMRDLFGYQAKANLGLSLGQCGPGGRTRQAAAATAIPGSVAGPCRTGRGPEIEAAFGLFRRGCDGGEFRRLRSACRGFLPHAARGRPSALRRAARLPGSDCSRPESERLAADAGTLRIVAASGDALS